MQLTALVPPFWRWLALAALAAALIGFGWTKGVAHVQAKWDAATLRQTLTVAKVRQRQAEATVQVVTEYVDRVRIVREKGAEIIKEVPVYVTVEADAACVLPRGFVRLHDAAAAGRLPGPAGSADASPSGVALSTATETVADNYQRCNENAEQLKALQTWVAAMHEASTGGP